MAAMTQISHCVGVRRIIMCLETPGTNYIGPGPGPTPLFSDPDMDYGPRDGCQSPDGSQDSTLEINDADDSGAHHGSA